jgi:hypothetical protein
VLKPLTLFWRRVVARKIRLLGARKFQTNYSQRRTMSTRQLTVRSGILKPQHDMEILNLQFTLQSEGSFPPAESALYTWVFARALHLVQALCCKQIGSLFSFLLWARVAFRREYAAFRREYTANVQPPHPLPSANINSALHAFQTTAQQTKLPWSLSNNVPCQLRISPSSRGTLIKSSPGNS